MTLTKLTFDGGLKGCARNELRHVLFSNRDRGAGGGIAAGALGLVLQLKCTETDDRHGVVILDVFGNGVGHRCQNAACLSLADVVLGGNLFDQLNAVLFYFLLLLRDFFLFVQTCAGKGSGVARL